MKENIQGFYVFYSQPVSYIFLNTANLLFTRKLNLYLCYAKKLNLYLC